MLLVFSCFQIIGFFSEKSCRCTFHHMYQNKRDSLFRLADSMGK